MAPSHSGTTAQSSAGSRRAPRVSRRIRKRSGVSTVNGSSPSKRARAQPNNSRLNSLRRRNAETNRRSRMQSSNGCFEENFFDSSNERSGRTRRAIRPNSTSVLGSGTRRQLNETFGVRSFLAHSPTPPPSGLELNDIFDAGFLDEVPSTPRVRCISFQSSPSSSPEREVIQNSETDIQQLTPEQQSSSSRRRTTRNRSTSQYDDPMERGIMGVRITPVNLGEETSEEARGDVNGRRRHHRRKRVVSLQSTPDASPTRTSANAEISRSSSVEVLDERSVVSEMQISSVRGPGHGRALLLSGSPVLVEEVSELQTVPLPQTPRRQHTPASASSTSSSGQAQTIGRRSVMIESGSPVAFSTPSTPPSSREHFSGTATGHSNAATVQLAESPVSRTSSTSRRLDRLSITRGGIAALNVRRPVLLSDDDGPRQTLSNNPTLNRTHASNSLAGRNSREQTIQATNETTAHNRIRTAAQHTNMDASQVIANNAFSGISPRTRRVIEAVLAEDGLPATHVTVSPPFHGRRQPSRAVSIRSSELARRNRNLGASLLGPMHHEMNPDDWHRMASVLVDVDLISNSDSDSSNDDGAMDFAGAVVEDEAAEARRRQESADYQLALRIAAEIEDDSPSGSTAHRTSPRGRGRCQRRISARSQRPLAPGQHCVICYEEQPDEPMGCLRCRQLIGCRKCIMKWRRTNNISELNRRSPLSMGCSSINHRKCPLCRAEWYVEPEIAPWDELRTD